MSAFLQDAAGRLHWVCQSCKSKFWESCPAARFGCHNCGAHNVETLLDSVPVGPTDQRLTEAVHKVT